jgi:hypothetical protein
MLAGCGSSGSDASPTTSRATTTTAGRSSTSTAPVRLVVLIEENHSAGQILGNADLPKINAMAAKGTQLEQYFAITHPSLPNYIALTSGDTQGITNDCTDCTKDVDNLGAQLQKAHISWRMYAQGLPGRCDESGSAGAYAKKHVPFLYYRSVLDDPEACANIVPFTQFATDAEAGRLPTVAFVIPDQAHDMHGVGGDNESGGQLERTADEFAGNVQETLATSPAWKQDTRLVVTWDEDDGDTGSTSCCGGLAKGGHIPFLVVGPKVAVGKDGKGYDHYSLLKSIEERYGLPLLGHAADPETASIPAITR